MQPPTTITDLIYEAQDRLIELGGGTDDGVAEYLEEAGVLGEPSCSESCVIAEWISRELTLAMRFDWAALEVQPNQVSYRASTISWLDGDPPYVGRQVELMPVLVDVANDFDGDELPELEGFDADRVYAFLRDSVRNLPAGHLARYF